MNPNEFGKFAVYLDSNEIGGINVECQKRIISGRHYYELYHLVSEWLKQNFESMFNRASGSTHQRLRVCCDLLKDEYKDRDFLKLGLKLKLLHDLRVHADYRLKESFGENELITLRSEKRRLLILLDLLDKRYFSRDERKIEA